MAKLSEYSSNAELKTYEIWEHLQAERRTHKIINIFLAVLCTALSVSLIFVSKKPPAVISIDQLGKAYYLEHYKTDSQEASPEEAYYVAETFITNYIGLISEVVDYQLAQALNLVTPSLQNQLKEEITKENISEKIKKAQIKTEIKFEKTDIEKEIDKYVYVDVLGIREIFPLDSLQSESKKEGFQFKLRLKRVPRSKTTPNGLLIDFFRNDFVSVETVEAWKNKELPKLKKEENGNE